MHGLTPNYPLRSAIAAVLLLLPLIISRLGAGTKRFWGTYTLGFGGFFFAFAAAGWLVRMGMDVMGETQVVRSVGEFAGISFVFAACAFCGGAFAEKTAGKMRRY
jgi:hypothetical protein